MLFYLQWCYVSPLRRTDVNAFTVHCLGNQTDSLLSLLGHQEGGSPKFSQIWGSNVRSSHTPINNGTTGEPSTCKIAFMGVIMYYGALLHIRNLVFSAGTQKVCKFSSAPLYSYVAQTCRTLPAWPTLKLYYVESLLRWYRSSKYIPKCRKCNKTTAFVFFLKSCCTGSWTHVPENEMVQNLTINSREIKCRSLFPLSVSQQASLYLLFPQT